MVELFGIKDAFNIKFTHNKTFFFNDKTEMMHTLDDQEKSRELLDPLLNF